MINVTKLSPVLLAASVAAGCAGVVGDPEQIGNGNPPGDTMQPGTPGGGPVVNTGTGGAGSNGGAATGLPCDVQALLQTRCQGCHGSPPLGGVPFSLVTFADAEAHAQAAVTAMMNGTMPAGGPRATAAEIQVMTKWIAAGFPMAAMACGATPGGGSGGATGGTNGMGGAAGTTVGGGTGGAHGGTGGAAGGTGGSGTAAGGLPCNVKDLVQTRCQSCHSSPPRTGAPFALVSFSDVQAHAQAALTDMTNGVMPLGGPRATSAQIQTLQNWINAGFPSGTSCGGGGTGTGGASGGTGGAVGGTGGAVGGTGGAAGGGEAGEGGGDDH
jgi:Cytochrome C oxidase, cbb3-type, subunit III